MRHVVLLALFALGLFSLGLGGCGGEEALAPTKAQIAELRLRSSAFDGREAVGMVNDPAANSLGRELFAAHCANCHGADARNGRPGVPDLIIGVFDYGDSAEAVRTTITQGRHSVMPNFSKEIGEADIGLLVSYVQSLSSGEDMGKSKGFATSLYEKRCVACHGADGCGSVAIGIPDLTDAYAQHGNSMMSIRLVITHGEDSQCPAQGGQLGGAEIELLTAYVLGLHRH